MLDQATAPAAQDVILAIENLRKSFPVTAAGGVGKAALLKAVEDVSFTMRRGEVVGLVGESGSGKSTIGKLVLRLLDASGGRVVFDGVDLNTLSRGELRRMRRRMQMIFQDPFSSLNPYFRIRDILAEALVVHDIGSGREDRYARVERLLELVGLPVSFATRYPHELSGGQRQRVGIARALAVEPALVVADEAVSALDVSNQAQILNVLMDLRAAFGLSMLFISHNMAVVQNIADSVVVLYLGRVMEIAPTEALFAAPHHPYTIALLSSIPIPDPELKRRRIALTGEIPSPIDPPSGCVFRTRCPVALPACAEQVPALRAVGEGRFSACIRDEAAASILA
ncbi:ABC transporter ATP-binding protein [Bosea sp. BK604]|uniref:ABC transporter ATP-binding protein n=1 Tax=Bosea sp. BK604 TaxID=2512180 RepID=UPI0010475739|nr:ABC transporter ATP-binding protein [Bosea sp. BK604]